MNGAYCRPVAIHNGVIKPMLKVLSLFSGIGAFKKALERIDEPFELINYCEVV